MTGKRGGFTLVELVVVLAIIAILSAFAAPRFFAPGALQDVIAAQEVASAARYAQKLAMASGCPVRLELDAAGYALRQPATAAPLQPCAAGFDRPVLAPGTGAAYTGRFPDDLQVSATPALPVALVFDARGVLVQPAALRLQLGDRTLSVLDAGGHVDLQ